MHALRQDSFRRVVGRISDEHGVKLVSKGILPRCPKVHCRTEKYAAIDYSTKDRVAVPSCALMFAVQTSKQTCRLVNYDAAEPDAAESMIPPVSLLSAVCSVVAVTQYVAVEASGREARRAATPCGIEYAA